MNLVTPQKAVEAAKLVTQGKSYPLGIIVDRNTPAFPPRFVSVAVLMPGQEDGRTIVMVTHNEAQAKQTSRTVRFFDGRQVQ